MALDYSPHIFLQTCGGSFPHSQALLLPPPALPLWDGDRHSLEAAASLVGTLQVTR